MFSSGEVVNDVYGVFLNFNSGAVSTLAKDIIADIGVDPAGGTSYGVLIPDLLCSSASIGLHRGGVNYYFPIFIRAGSSIACRASVNNATVGTVRVWMRLFGQPRRPDLIKVGQYVTAVGIVSASSRGTTITAGTTSEGAWTSLGTPTRPHWWWQCGFGVNDGSLTATGIYFLDVGAGASGSQKVILEEQPVSIIGTTEDVSKPLICPASSWCDVPENVQIWGRMQCSGTADSGLSMAAYGLGG